MKANPHPHLWAKSADNGSTSLLDHLEHVATAAEVLARHANLDPATARLGALLHDIGKASPIFQERLRSTSSRMQQPFRHELASLLFMPLVPTEQRTAVLEMVVAHHKSLYDDAGKLGLLDLDEYDEEQVYFHAQRWNEWAPAALDLLAQAGVATVRPISQAEAEAALQQAVADGWRIIREHRYGWSRWKGLLVGADHLASALAEGTADAVKTAFHKPVLDCFVRGDKTGLYPLSNHPANSPRPHTLVTAPTGAGKTDYLLRRCRGRVFYVLPFQASINAMHGRLSKALEPTGADVRLLHASSRVLPAGNGRAPLDFTEKALQDKVGASVKVLTPHQLAGIAFGTRGYETLLLDVQGCDIILDEIHTYTSVSQAIVLKLVEILSQQGCRLHIGTATMPSVLYEHVAALLGRNHVHEVCLPDAELDTYDRHLVFKEAGSDVETWLPIVKQAVQASEKVLLVFNRVRHAQDAYEDVQTALPNVRSMLLHSRFKRVRRAELEQQLLLDFNPEDKPGPCVVVSTQVVEVSLDISFDRMVTEAAPLDALVQRFGRINRRRTVATRGQPRPVHVLAPPETDKDAKPYELPTVQASYAALPHAAVLRERDVQRLIDEVYPTVDFTDVHANSVFRDGQWQQHLLTHRSRSYLLGLLEIDSVACVLEQDAEAYRAACQRRDEEEQTRLEIPLSFRPHSLRQMKQLDCGHRPYRVPDTAYTDDTGLRAEKIRLESGQFYEL